MVEYKANIYVRCIGLLYFRFVADPSKLWSFMGRYIENEERKIFLLRICGLG